MVRLRRPSEERYAKAVKALKEGITLMDDDVGQAVTASS